MFCRKPLGANEVVESFPVGRRLAFDAARGRLWVVCAKCERWNLSPLEERWEAVEDCERIFRGTRIRVSTENIGLARHPEGFTLVRVGEPLRPEFAAWRYGDQFGRRRRKKILYGVGGGVLVGSLAVGAFAAGVAGSALLGQSGNLANLLLNGANARQAAPGGRRGDQAQAAGPAEHPAASLRRRRPVQNPDPQGQEGRRMVPRRRSSPVRGRPSCRTSTRWGGNKETVRQAVDRIETAGHPERFLADIADGDRFKGKKGVPGYIDKMPKPTKLALEMALHEEQERRALEGELWVLERAWREAEEIAEISDNPLPAGWRGGLHPGAWGESGRRETA